MSITRRLLGIYIGIAVLVGLVVGIVVYRFAENNPSLLATLHLPALAGSSVSTQTVVASNDAGLSARVSELTGKLAAEEGARKASEVRIAALESKSAEQEKLKADVAAFGTSLDRIEKNVAASVQKANDLEAALKDVPAVRNELAAARQSITDLQTKSREIDALQAEDQRVKRSINELAKSIVAFKADLGAVSSNGKVFSSRLAQLEKTLTEERASLMEVRTHMFLQGPVRGAEGDRDYAAVPARSDVQVERPPTRSTRERLAECDRHAKNKTEWESCIAHARSVSRTVVPATSIPEASKSSIVRARRLYADW